MKSVLENNIIRFVAFTFIIGLSAYVEVSAQKAQPVQLKIENLKTMNNEISSFTTTPNYDQTESSNALDDADKKKKKRRKSKRSKKSRDIKCPAFN